MPLSVEMLLNLCWALDKYQVAWGARKLVQQLSVPSNHATLRALQGL